MAGLESAYWVLSGYYDQSCPMTQILYKWLLFVTNALQMNSAFIVSTASQGKTVDGEETNGDQSKNKSITVDEGDEFDFTAIKGCTQATLNAQKMVHVFFELDQATPKLEQLAAVLSSARMNHPDVSRVVGFVEKLKKLKVELVCMIVNVVSDKPISI